MSRALRRRHDERLVHTGQHWADTLSRVFFEELRLPRPDLHLGASHMTPAPRLACIVRGLRADIRGYAPDVVLAYGDTDTTLGAALAARAEGALLAHVEAGLRSGRRRMPEEINRVAVDHLAALLLCPTAAAAATLRAERAAGCIDGVGDVMLDALQHVPEAASEQAARELGSTPGTYLVATIHRAASTDDPERLLALLRSLGRLEHDVVFPCHPRTRAAIEALGPLFDAGAVPRLRIIAPLGHVAMVGLLRGARGVLTDSGGLQKEAWFLGVPCATLREETEWTETLGGGWNVLVGAAPERIAEAVRLFAADRPQRDLGLFGGGCAAARVVAALERLVARPDAPS